MGSVGNTRSPSAILLVSCPDQTGLVANITQFVHANNGNIVRLDEHVDQHKKTFLMRAEWELDGFWIPRDRVAERFAPIAERFAMTWDLRFSDSVQRMAVFVSKQGHCLHDILAHASSGEWQVEIPLIVSNHTVLADVASRFGIDFHHTPVSEGDKAAAEQVQLELLDRYAIDLVVLARYMQIVSADFVSRWSQRIINIHHSFLPAFAGAKPYHAAFERGVKIIGATSHYVTADLDGGPIIEQDVVRISHKDAVADLVRKGKELEKLVLSRAIWYHLNHKLLVYDNRTVVFD
ncbi:MAG: formyltetrahydrofolate deformylase [Polyangiaceae bacterium]|jgi:formyltetrahydrofolate deformylase|nr:formyltetrahydrofolate deformylase [Polyangiaceae bacterium]